MLQKWTQSCKHIFEEKYKTINQYTKRYLMTKLVALNKQIRIHIHDQNNTVNTNIELNHIHKLLSWKQTCTKNRNQFKSITH